MQRSSIALLIAVMLSGLSIGVRGSDAETLHIDWSDLRPAVAAGPVLPIEERDDLRRRKPAGVDLLGKTVELSGYLLPADREGDLVYSFLLLPEYGGCIHTPSPPTNQIILVTPSQPFRATHIYEVVSVAGQLAQRHEKTQLFVIDGVKVVESAYSIASAVVAESDRVTGAQPPGGNPWKRLGGPPTR